MNTKAQFIVLEGIDGSGKSTLAQGLVAELMKTGKACVSFSEPTRNGTWGKKIRGVLQSNVEVDAELSRILLDYFMKDRIFDLEENIMPALSKGKVVVLDRYFYSTAAYQSLNVNHLASIIEEYRDTSIFTLPDKLFYLDLKPIESIKRLQKRETHQEVFEVESVLTKIYNNYDYIFTECKLNFPVYRIDATQDANKVLAECLKFI